LSRFHAWLLAFLGVRAAFDLRSDAVGVVWSFIVGVVLSERVCGGFVCS
jgi:hypothetical protein